MAGYRATLDRGLITVHDISVRPMVLYAYEILPSWCEILLAPSLQCGEGLASSACVYCVCVRLYCALQASFRLWSRCRMTQAVGVGEVGSRSSTSAATRTFCCWSTPYWTAQVCSDHKNRITTTFINILIMPLLKLRHTIN